MEAPANMLLGLEGVRKMQSSSAPRFSLDANSRSCALDGLLLTDPVISPHGHVFDHASLAAALAQKLGCSQLELNSSTFGFLPTAGMNLLSMADLRNGGLCPFTGNPLRVDMCIPDADLRSPSLAQRVLSQTGSCLLLSILVGVWNAKVLVPAASKAGLGPCCGEQLPSA